MKIEFEYYKKLSLEILDIVGMSNEKINLYTDTNVEGNYAKYSLDFNTNTFSYGLQLDLEPDNKDDFVDAFATILGLKEYIENIVSEDYIQQYDLYLFIFNIIHEVGHIHFYRKFYREENVFLQLENLEEFMDKYCWGVFDFTDNHMLQQEAYMLKPQELYANQFAFKWFPIIIKKLENKKLI